MIDNAQERLPRLLALVPWLAARPGVTLSETAKHFDISVDQLTTDLYQLVVCGLPGYGPDQLVDIDFYDEEHIWVTDPQTLVKPLKFTAEEVVALSIALRLLTQIPGLEFREDIENLMAKLDSAAGHLNSAVNPELVRIQPQANADVASVIDQSITQRTKIEFEYHSGRDQVTHRVVSPVKVFAVDDHLYLDAYCDSAEARRLFRFDRIVRPVLLDTAVASQVDANFKFNIDLITSAPKALIEIAPEYAWLAEDPWFEVVQHEPLRVSIPYLSMEWLLHWTLSAGGGAKIIEPLEAAERLCRLIESSVARITPGD